MKKFFLAIFLILTAVGCDDNEPQSQKDDNSFNIEGTWYISGRAGIYQFENDSVTHGYDEKVLGYEEHSIKRVQGESNLYSISTKMRYLSQRMDEVDEDFVDRVERGLYSTDELKVFDIESPRWIVSGNDIYISGEYFSSSEDEKEKKYLVSKIVKYSKDTFVIVSLCPTIWDCYLDETSAYRYYTTFTRIE